MKTQLTMFGLLLSTLALGQVRPDQSQIKYDITGTTELYTLDNGSIRRVLIQTIDSLNVPGVYEKTVLSDTTGITDEQKGDVMFNSGKDTIAFRGTYGWLVFVGGGGGTWGSITGTLSSQTDLQAALDAKLSAEVDGSTTNELDTMTLDGDSGTMNLSDGVTLIIAGGGINSTSVSGNTLTVTGTEVDGSTTNELILKQENSSTLATSDATNNYHSNSIGIGDFSANTLAAGLHLYGTSNATIRLSDSCSTDTCALSYVDFYRGYNTTNLGQIGFTSATDPDLYVTNFLAGGNLKLRTDGVTKLTLNPSGQLLLPLYGDTTFTDTYVKLLGVTDNGDVIEVDTSDIGGSSLWTQTGSDIYYNTGNAGVGVTSPSARMDVNDATNPDDQFRIRSSYNPSGTADAAGNTGSFAWSDNHLHIKTSAGWQSILTMPNDDKNLLNTDSDTLEINSDASNPIQFFTGSAVGGNPDLWINNGNANKRTRVLVQPSGSGTVAKVGVTNSSSLTNYGYVEIGARDEYGVFGVLNAGTPATALTKLGIEIDPNNNKAGEEFIVGINGFFSTGAPTEILKVTSSDVTTTATAVTMDSGSSAVKWIVGSGTPEGSVTAPVGSLYSRTDGGASTTLYVKESGTGNTGWVAK